MKFFSEKIILFNLKTTEVHVVKTGQITLQEYQQQKPWSVVSADFWGKDSHQVRFQVDNSLIGLRNSWIVDHQLLKLTKGFTK